MDSHSRPSGATLLGFCLPQRYVVPAKTCEFHAECQVLSTVAVPFTLLRQSMAKKAPQPTKISRKQSTEDEHAMEMA